MTESEGSSIEFTPTWAVAAVCIVFVVVSLLVERGIHYIGKWLKKHNQKSLNQALDKMKNELMLLGFMSLLLTVFQTVITDICMPQSFLEHLLPCKIPSPEDHLEESNDDRKLLFFRRILTGSQDSKCLEKGKVPLISMEGLHELHIFIFVMAVLHVSYSCLTLLLGRYKVYGWRSWELEAQSENDSQKEHEAQEIFVHKHLHSAWRSSIFRSWMLCFFRQFGRTVRETDYKTLRQGFIKNHNIRSNFDFHRYVNRVLEDDFKKVVGVSAYLWMFVVLFLLFNVHGWQAYFWMAFIPLLLTLIVGMKLQHIMMKLAMDIAEFDQEAAVQPRNELFWFNRPKLILHLLHFVMFQNAFELAFFFWVLATFGLESCFMDNLGFIIVRLIIGVAVQVLCSYSTLPLYALVTQMGSHYKRAIFDEHVAALITDWHANVRKKMKKHSPFWTEQSPQPAIIEMSMYEVDETGNSKDPNDYRVMPLPMQQKRYNEDREDEKEEAPLRSKSLPQQMRQAIFRSFSAKT